MPSASPFLTKSYKYISFWFSVSSWLFKSVQNFCKSFFQRKLFETFHQQAFFAVFFALENTELP